MLTREQIESQLGIKVNKITYSPSSEFVYLFDFEDMGIVPIPPQALNSPKRFTFYLLKHSSYKLPYISEEIFNYLVSLWLKMVSVAKKPLPKFQYLKSLEIHFDNFLEEHLEVTFRNQRVFKLSNLITYLRSLRIWIPRWQILYFLRRNGWEPYSTGSSRNWIQIDDQSNSN